MREKVAFLNCGCVSALSPRIDVIWVPPPASIWAWLWPCFKVRGVHTDSTAAAGSYLSTLSLPHLKALCWQVKGFCPRLLIWNKNRSVKFKINIHIFSCCWHCSERFNVAGMMPMWQARLWISRWADTDLAQAVWNKKQEVLRHRTVALALEAWGKLYKQ